MIVLSFHSRISIHHLTSGLQWFNDVFSTDISNKCEDVLNLLVENHGCKVNFYVLLRLEVEFLCFNFLTLDEKDGGDSYPRAA